MACHGEREWELATHTHISLTRKGPGDAKRVQGRQLAIPPTLPAPLLPPENALPPILANPTHSAASSGIHLLPQRSGAAAVLLPLPRSPRFRKRGAAQS